MRRFLYCIVCVVLVSSCATRNEIVYLQPSEHQADLLYAQYAPRIQKEDILTITVSSENVTATIPFNQQNPYQTNVASSNDFTFKPTYTVDTNGEIDFPVLGKIKVEGLTRMEATELLRNRLRSEQIKDAGVNLTFANFRVTVMGEVRSPNTYTLKQERITVLEALAMAGDMTIKGRRDNVLLIRENGGRKEMQRLNLLTDSLLSSPYYYLAQNDVIYVEPNKTQVRAASLGQDTNVLISVTSLIITIVTLVVTNSKK